MKHLVTFVVTCGYIGKIPLMPGTLGTLAAAALVFFFPYTSLVLILFIVSTILGLVWAKQAIELLEGDDPPSFVLDEFAGMMLALLFLPLSLEVILTAFILFRFFDIVKPLGIRALDEMEHPTSVMWDDLLAGAYTNILLQIATRVF